MNAWKKAELKVQALLLSRGIKFDDVSGNPEYWKLDIDLIVHSEKGDISIEIKNDSWLSKTGNLFLETITDIENKKEGWFAYSAADLLYYIDDNNELLFIYKMEELRNYISQQSAAYIKRHTKQCHLDKNKTSEGICVPAKDIEHLCKGVINLEEALR